MSIILNILKAFFVLFFGGFGIAIISGGLYSLFTYPIAEGIGTLVFSLIFGIGSIGIGAVAIRKLSGSTM